MPHQTDGPYVTLIAKTNTLPDNVSAWLKSIGVEDKWVESILDKQKTDAERLVELAGRRCYMSYQVGLNPNVQKIRTNILDYITNILNNKDGSIFEHVYFTFSIEQVSRVFTGEMNRHRAGMAISEASMRYIRYEDIPYWVPTIWQGDSEKEQKSRDCMKRAFQAMETEYANLQEIWKDELALDSPFKRKKEVTSAMRRIIGMGVSTGGIWTGNVRALRHIFEMRCSPFAEEEILLVATLMLNVMKETEPILFGDFNTDELGFSKPKYSKV